MLAAAIHITDPVASSTLPESDMPAAMRSFIGATTRAEKDGLVITFQFGEWLSRTEGREAARYCASVFNDVGFNVPKSSIGWADVEHPTSTDLQAELTDVSLFVPADNVAGDQPGLISQAIQLIRKVQFN